MPGGRCARAALLAAVSGLWAASAFPALVRSQPLGPPRSTGDAPVEFDIPAQPLARALNAWAVQANAQVFVDPDPVAHLTAPAIKGNLLPRQALRTLLAHTNLEVIQGRDNVFVIRPRALRTAAPKAHSPPAVTSKPTVAPVPAAAAPATAVATIAGPWLLRIAATTTKDSGGGRTGGSAAVGGEYFLSNNVAVALTLDLPRTHSFMVAARQTAAAYRGSARLQTSALSMKYYFASHNPLRPYVGAGLNVTVLSDASGTPGLDRVTVGPAVQAGLDWALGPHWMLNADVSWEGVRPGISAGPGPDIHIDPLQIGLGVAYRFAAPGAQ